MFRRKLKAINYHKTDINVEDEKQWRTFIVWLEDQKIRLYKIEDRAALRALSSTNWSKAFMLYLQDLECPVNRDDRKAVCDWLLGHAVRQEYGENVEKYKSVQGVTNGSGGKTADPFQHLEVSSTNFKEQLASLCEMLNIPPHYDPVTSLQAVSILVKDRLSASALQAELEEGEVTDLADYALGFETKDKVLDTAAKVLRLLHIQELRELQTKINEAIVAVQTITANPKTDSKLGKVGR